jgi:hypothetical protein
MEKKINKNNVEYVCPKCLKSFGNHKYHLDVHLNKKYPCGPKDTIKQNKSISNIDSNIDNNIDVNSKIEFVGLSDNKINNEHSEKANLDNFELSQTDITIELLNKINLIIKQNEEFKKQNEEFKKQNEEFKEDIKILKEDNEMIKSQLTTSNSKSQILYKPDININVQINNFNNIDYSKIDKKMLINTLVQNTGKQIYLKAIENVYINPECPQNHSIYVADKNRGYIKKYNNGRWETDNLNIIDLLINNFVDYYKLSLEEIKQKPELHNKLKNNIQTKLKYLDLCDLEYLANLEDDLL